MQVKEMLALAWKCGLKHSSPFLLSHSPPPLLTPKSTVSILQFLLAKMLDCVVALSCQICHTRWIKTTKLILNHPPLQGALSDLDAKTVPVLKFVHWMPEMQRWKVCAWNLVCHLAPPHPSSCKILHGVPAWQHNMLLSCQMLHSHLIPNWWPKRFCLHLIGIVLQVIVFKINWSWLK